MSSARILESNARTSGPMGLALAPLRLLAALVCLSIGALLGLIEPLVSLMLATLAVLALLLSGFYAFAVPFKAFPVFGLLGAALVLSVLVGLLRALRHALTFWL